MRLRLTADPELPVPRVNYGGIERIVADLAAGLRTNGHTFGLVAHPDSTAPVDAFYPWSGRASQNALDTAKNCRTVMRAAKEFRPDELNRTPAQGGLAEQLGLAGQLIDLFTPTVWPHNSLKRWEIAKRSRPAGQRGGDSAGIGSTGTPSNGLCLMQAETRFVDVLQRQYRVEHE